jgi:hypothetical protein
MSMSFLHVRRKRASLRGFVVHRFPALFLAMAVLCLLTSDASAGPLLKRLRERRSQAGCGTTVFRPAAPATVSGGCTSGSCSIK